MFTGTMNDRFFTNQKERAKYKTFLDISSRSSPRTRLVRLIIIARESQKKLLKDEILCGLLGHHRGMF